MHLKHNSCHMSRWPWPTPHHSVIDVELLGAAVSRWRADLQHTLATQRWRYWYGGRVDRRWDEFQRDDNSVCAQDHLRPGTATTWPLLPTAGHTLRLLRHHVTRTCIIFLSASLRRFTSYRFVRSTWTELNWRSRANSRIGMWRTHWAPTVLVSLEPVNRKCSRGAHARYHWPMNASCNWVDLSSVQFMRCE